MAFADTDHEKINTGNRVTHKRTEVMNGAFWSEEMQQVNDLCSTRSTRNSNEKC
eukprot:gene4276-3093_t